MFRLDPQMIAEFTGKNLIAFGTGGLGKLLVPYLLDEPNIRLYGMTNSRVTEADAGTFLNVGLPIRSLTTWKELMPEAAILLCVAPKNEIAAKEVCETAGFYDIITVPLDVIEMAQNLSFGGEYPAGHPIFHYICMANELYDVHKASFSEFKGCHLGQTVAVVATGPSMNHYIQLPNVPHVGVNDSIFRENIHLDYYFVWDYIPGKTEKLKGYDCVKFMGRDEWNSVDYKIPEFIFEENHARRFFIGRPSHQIYTDIEYYPLMGFYSIIFPAIQFAIFMRPKRLLLIGCDCAANGHFNGGEFPIDRNVQLWLRGYKKLKEFVGWNYPDMEIISVNPVGLKGVFRDMYTESYLKEHPEIDRVKCEIFKPEDFVGELI